MKTLLGQLAAHSPQPSHLFIFIISIGLYDLPQYNRVIIIKRPCGQDQQTGCHCDGSIFQKSILISTLLSTQEDPDVEGTSASICGIRRASIKKYGLVYHLRYIITYPFTVIAEDSLLNIFLKSSNNV
jgi:hypothetical protein